MFGSWYEIVPAVCVTQAYASGCWLGPWAPDARTVRPPACTSLAGHGRGAAASAEVPTRAARVS